MPGNWPVPFGKGPSEKDPRHGNLVGGLLHLTGGGWKRSDLATVTAVKRPAGETRGKNWLPDLTPGNATAPAPDPTALMGI